MYNVHQFMAQFNQENKTRKEEEIKYNNNNNYCK